MRAVCTFAVPSVVPRVAQTVLARMSASVRARVLVIAGPTAIGKSSTALSLAQSMQSEIISADSVQVFRGLDVGSNKSSEGERALVPHHLLDVVDPACDEYSAGEFFRAARKAADDIISRGKVPIVVGGTMMYLRWFVHGPPATPPASGKTKIKVLEMLDRVEGDWDNALKLLEAVDAERAKQLSRNDWYRLRRALEVVYTANAPMTQLPQQGASPKSTQPQAASLPFDFRCVFLYDSRIDLNRRIDARCEQMILPQEAPTPEDVSITQDTPFPERSILSEVGNLLLARGFRVTETAPSRAIGYRQTIAYLLSRALRYIDAGETEAASDAFNHFRQFVSDFQQSTRNYAKQQLSWFRKEPFFRWVRSGPGCTQVIRSLLDLDFNEYQVLQDVTKDAQAKARDDMVEQGKAMRTYIAEKVVLHEESVAEQKAVHLAERIARKLSENLPRDEVSRLLNFVQR